MLGWWPIESSKPFNCHMEKASEIEVIMRSLTQSLSPIEMILTFESIFADFRASRRLRKPLPLGPSLAKGDITIEAISTFGNFEPSNADGCRLQSF